MFNEVHDSCLAGYAADLTGNRLVLIIEPPDAPRFKIAFDGLAAYKLTTSLRPILFGIYEVEAHVLVEEEWSVISQAFAEIGWPGPWAASIDDAKAYLARANLSGYRVTSSYGLDAWILAQGVSKLG